MSPSAWHRYSARPAVGDGLTRRCSSDPSSGLNAWGAGSLAGGRSDPTRGLRESLRHEDVRLADAICIGQNARDGVAEPLIEPERVVVEVSDVPQAAQEIVVEVDVGERGLAVLVIGPQPHR